MNGEDIRPAGIGALPDALAWHPQPGTVVYLHRDLTGRLMIVGWDTPPAPPPPYGSGE